jgi:hypothetical protein
MSHRAAEVKGQLRGQNPTVLVRFAERRSRRLSAAAAADDQYQPLIVGLNLIRHQD